MFDDSVLEAYRDVKAPDRLKEKILETASVQPSKKADANIISFAKLRSFGLTAAACLLLAVGSWGLLGGGVTLAESNSNEGISVAREVTSPEIDFEVSQRGFSKVSVSDGELVCGEKSGEELCLFGNETVKWIAPSEFDGEAGLTVSRYGKKIAYRICQNADSGEFEIRPAE